MAKLIIEGYIGYGINSARYIKNFLDENKKKAVTLAIASFGGDYNEALKIRDHIAEHGNVTIEYHAFNASSATVIGLKAKKVRAEKSSFYLAHKVLTWIDEWGYMNEDDLSKLIEDLTNIKDNAEKITLGLANDYATKTGKTPAELLNLMKKESWLTADEAKNDWGFIDEVFEAGKEDQVFDNVKMVAAINASGLPPVPRKKEQESNLENETKQMEDNIVSRVLKGLGNAFNSNSNHKNSTKNMTDQKKLAALCALLAVASIEVDKENGAYMNEETLTAINDKLEKFAAMEEQLKTANEAKEKAEADLKAANDTIAQRDETITAHEATIADLKDEPGTPGAQANTSGDDKPQDGKVETVAKGEDFGEDLANVASAYLGEEI